MSREVRRVPANWVHPVYPADYEHERLRGQYKPMLDTSYDDAVQQWQDEELPEWLEGAKLWAEGFVKTYANGVVPIAQVVAEANNPPDGDPTYAWWAGEPPGKPDPGDYMPDWPEDERTHYMMYEAVSEGTPISPAFATPEELARWLTDTGADACAGMTATYDQWLKLAKGAYAPTMIIQNGVVKPGVSILDDEQ